ncbi:hypothetical protein B0T16DRAFT_404188 [Cercophora newfieldiana]|uniref:Uncharacterized protein n=1 Tax=Cercophora newfieldiana TaxID=92897 RepID=A0AA39YF98_9PEZI|nr:hypothetical protein B0T16DRAFT_404188 [Cercophora newfieldiana]
MTDPDNLDSGLLAISLDSDSEDSSSSTPAECTAPPTRADRSALSDSAFQHLKETYRPKVENGEIWSTITFPVGKTKPEAQELLHAAEELYFFRRYQEAVRFVERVFSEEEGQGEAVLDEDTKKLLRVYEARARTRVAASGVVDSESGTGDAALS